MHIYSTSRLRVTLTLVCFMFMSTWKKCLLFGPVQTVWSDWIRTENNCGETEPSSKFIGCMNKSKHWTLNNTKHRQQSIYSTLKINPKERDNKGTGNKHMYTYATYALHAFIQIQNVLSILLIQGQSFKQSEVRGLCVYCMSVTVGLSGQLQGEDSGWRMSWVLAGSLRWWRSPNRLRSPVSSYY